MARSSTGWRRSMTTRGEKEFLAAVILSAGLVASGCGTVRNTGGPEPLVIQAQGSFAVGGTVLTAPGTFDPVHPSVAGQTFHGDHAYTFFQIPPNARKLPLVLW